MNILKSKKIIGIDLGTTNSVIAILEGANPNIIPNSEGHRTTPSIVAYTKKEETLVGQIAKRQAILNPENTFYSIKRFIGCKFEEIKNELKYISYSIKKDNTGNIKLYSPILKKYFSPEELSAAILKKLVNDANKYLNENISQAIITVPAYFNDSQRLATKDAGAIASLNVLRILNEPTAAALAYGLNSKKNEIILIFDIGGGTFDVSILEVGDEVFEVLSTAGDTHLGGDDFDQLIVNYIINEFNSINNINLSLDKQALQRIIEASEKAKIELSSLDFTQINLPFIYINDKSAKHIDLEFSKKKFEDLSQNLLERCKEPLYQALKDAKISKSDINQVILVGGSTRIPAIKNLLINSLGKPLNETVNPDEVVALGAAIQAGIIAGEITDLILLDVTPLSLGVETDGGIMTPIITRNSSIPIKQSDIFSTGSDFQEIVEIHILQGERTFAKDNKSLGLFQLINILKEKRGIPQIKVTFQLDVNGLLSVSAREEKSGKEHTIKIEGASVLDRNEINQIIKNSEENSILDKYKKIFIRIKLSLDRIFTNSLPIFNNSYINYNIQLYYIEVLKECQILFTKNKPTQLLNKSLYKLKFIFNIYLFKFVISLK